MSPEELARKCVHAINGGWEHVQLVIPGHVRGQRVRLDRTSRRKCPIGEHVCDLENSTLAAFSATEVLAWLVANGAIGLAQHVPQPVPHVELRAEAQSAVDKARASNDPTKEGYSMAVRDMRAAVRGLATKQAAAAERD